MSIFTNIAPVNIFSINTNYERLDNKVNQTSLDKNLRI